MASPKVNTRDVLVMLVSRRLEETGYKPCTVPELEGFDDCVQVTNELRNALHKIDCVRADMLQTKWLTNQVADAVETVCETYCDEQTEFFTRVIIGRLIGEYNENLDWRHIYAAFIMIAEICAKYMRHGKPVKILQTLSLTNELFTTTDVKEFYKSQNGWENAPYLVFDRAALIRDPVQARMSERDTDMALHAMRHIAKMCAVDNSRTSGC